MHLCSPWTTSASLCTPLSRFYRPHRPTKSDRPALVGAVSTPSLLMKTTKTSGVSRGLNGGLKGKVEGEWRNGGGRWRRNSKAELREGGEILDVQEYSEAKLERGGIDKKRER